MKRSATRDPHRGPTQGTHTEGTHTGDPHRGPAQGTHTGDPHRGEGPTDYPSPEGRATQGTHTEHTQTPVTCPGFNPNPIGEPAKLMRSCDSQEGSAARATRAARVYPI